MSSKKQVGLCFFKNRRPKKRLFFFFLRAWAGYLLKMLMESNMLFQGDKDKIVLYCEISENAQVHDEETKGGYEKNIIL